MAVADPEPLTTPSAPPSPLKIPELAQSPESAQ